MKTFSINGKIKKTVGEGQPAFIIAEMSGNHHQSLEKAIEIIDAAADAGADAIKIQTYTPDTITLKCETEPFQVKINEAWKGETLYSLYEKAHTPWEWQAKLKEHAESKGLVFFSAPFDITAVGFLEELDIPIYKIASFEIGHIPLLEKVGKTKKPVIVSSGLATEEEIELAIKTLKEAGCPKVAVLHCVVSYPAKPEQMNLATIADIGKKFNVIPGFSDHSLETEATAIAISQGAKIIEKHLIISRDEGGPDAGFSLEPSEFKEMVQAVRAAEKGQKPDLEKAEVEKRLGKACYGPREGEAENKIFRPSIWVVKNVAEGEIFTEKNLIVRRPGNGLEPKHYKEVLGKKASKTLKKCTALKADSVQK